MRHTVWQTATNMVNKPDDKKSLQVDHTPCPALVDNFRDLLFLVDLT